MPRCTRILYTLPQPASKAIISYSLQENYTIIIVTHSMQQAARISQHTAFFHLGRVIEYGNTKQIFTNPKSMQTQEYITGRFG